MARRVLMLALCATVIVVCLAAIAGGTGGAAASDDGPTARQRVRPGQALDFRPLRGRDVPEDANVRVVVRSRGEQRIVPTGDGDPGAAGDRSNVWRFTPKHAGTCVVATVVESSHPRDGARRFEYEKLFFDVGDDGDASVPSASATAAFGHRLELLPLVDPARIVPGADLPIRVKVDGARLEAAAVVCSRDERGAPDGRLTVADGGAEERPPAAAAPAPEEIRLVTSPSGTVVVPIRSAGSWRITVEHRLPAPPGAADGGQPRPPDTLRASMVFVVSAPLAPPAPEGAQP